jgi:hypothetical protein
MAVLSLDSYKAIQANLFVKITITGGTNLLFSDRIQSTSIGGDTYVGLGNLMSISGSNSELRSSGQDLTISISGIPDSAISDITGSSIKGSGVKIIRGLFNATTGSFLNAITGNPITRFSGYVNNVALDEEYDVLDKTSSNTIILSCASNVDVLNNKISGRRTNNESQNKFFPNDVSMDRVSAIESTYFDFGANK